MKTKFTYKEFSMIVGIVVAIIVAMTYFMNGQGKIGRTTGSLRIPSITAFHPEVILKKISEVDLTH